MDEKLKHFVQSLEDNESDVRDETRKILLNICRNVLKSPNDEKFRELYLSSEDLQTLLFVDGAIQCLFEIGYVEDGDRLYLPFDHSLSKVQRLVQLLHKRRKTKDSKHGFVTLKSFYVKIMQYFQDVLLYENPNLQSKARNVVPIVELEHAALRKMRELQKFLKLNKTTNSASSHEELSFKDLFLIELLYWFKHEFFKWMDKPLCRICSIECKYEKTLPTIDPFCSRIELYRCNICNMVAEFPRFTHPEPLLTQRYGRCGEWANAFTLLCRSFGYDSRLVCDETDHVWTEIWSESEKRWIHVDPCENVIDKPLMYEKGWKKKLSYVIAYSKDEVQDVTWRYTRDQEAVMARRKICPENNLINLLQSLSRQRQFSTNYSQVRREYVIKRNLLELASMLRVPNSQDDADEMYEGRNSGSLAWRLARGEVTQINVEKKGYIWQFPNYGQMFELRYNIIRDTYRFVRNDGIILEGKSGWLEGTNAMEGGIFRKVENDWMMVYLARSPRAERGIVKWSFEMTNSNLCLETFSLNAKSEVFHGASVSWVMEAISSDNKTVVIPIVDSSNFYTKEVDGAVRFNVIVTLSGGEGELAWQHAQLFRQNLANSEDSVMIISVALRNHSE